jgi:hypothetical protein
VAVHSEQDQRDWDWREEAYRRYFRREVPSDGERLRRAREVAPLKGADVVSGEGVGMVKSGRLWAIYRLEWEGDKVLKSDVEEAAGEFLYTWDRLSPFADRFLLGDWRSRV